MTIIKGINPEKFERQPFKMPTLEEMKAMFGEGGPPAPPGMSPGTEKPVPAVMIKNGKLIPEESKLNLITSGTVKDITATGVEIKIDSGTTGGFHVRGEGTEYTISDSIIKLSGNGSGLGGPGSGASCDDHSTLVLKNVNIETNGVARCATAAENGSILKVYNSTLIAHGAPFDSVPKIFGIVPPAALEIEGNCRAHCTMSNSYSYFYDSTIIADGWAALSTDASMGFVHLEATRCKVKTIKSGYGTYADGGCHNFFNDCDFESACMAAILAGESDITFNNTRAKCGTYFAMIHCVMGSPTEVSTLNVKGSEITCEKPAVIVKSQNAIINFDNVKINSTCGTLIKSIWNDDPNATKTKGQKVYGIHTTFKNMDIAGDIVHEDPDRSMSVYLISTTLKGAIKDAFLTLDGNSKWVAERDSTVSLVGNVDISQIDAPEGITINAIAAQEGTFKLPSGGILNLINQIKK